MSNFRASLINYADEGTLSDPVDGDVVYSLPLSNLRVPRLSKLCRKTSQTTFNHRIDFGSGQTRPIQVVGILGHNMEEAFVTARLYNNALTLIAEETPLVVWTPPNTGMPNHTWLFFDAEYNARRIDVFSGSTGSNPYEAGRLWAGPLWTPPDGAVSDQPVEQVDTSRVRIAPGGQMWSTPGVRLRQVELGFEVEHAWAYGDGDGTLDLQQIDFLVGNHRDIVVWPRTQLLGSDNQNLIHRLGIYGRRSQYTAIKPVDDVLYQQRWTVTEIR